MTEDDLPGADALRQLAGWNQRPEDWRRMLGFEPDGCFVAVRDEVVVGTVTTITYGRALAWIGMMLVHPDHRRQGIGHRLMRQALEYLRSRGVPVVKLDATPAGYPVYEKLGFVPEWSLTRWQQNSPMDPPDHGTETDETRILSEPDWSTVNEIDAAAFGVPRFRLVSVLAQRSRSVRVWPGQGGVRGWGLLRIGANADYLGPIAATDPAAFLPLAAALLRRTGNPSVFWDIPDQNVAAVEAARRFGFGPVRPLTRMRLGPDNHSGNPLV